jgi:hypothetical protein
VKDPVKVEEDPAEMLDGEAVKEEMEGFGITVTFTVEVAV